MSKQRKWIAGGIILAIAVAVFAWRWTQHDNDKPLYSDVPATEWRH